MPIPPQLSLGTSRAAARRDVLSFLPDMKLPNGPTVGLVLHVFRRLEKKSKEGLLLCPFAFVKWRRLECAQRRCRWGLWQVGPASCMQQRSLSSARRVPARVPRATACPQHRSWRLAGWIQARRGGRGRRGAREGAMMYCFNHFFRTSPSPRALSLPLCSRGGAWGGEHRAGAPDGARGASDAHHQDAVACS